MGAIDLLKGIENKVIDAATYSLLERNFQLLEDNARLFKEKAEHLEGSNSRLKAENESLRQLQSLNDKLSQISEVAAFETSYGFSFRRKPDGSFEETPYCPNCHIVIGSPSSGNYACAGCGYTLHVERVERWPQMVVTAMNNLNRFRAEQAAKVKT